MRCPKSRYPIRIIVIDELELIIFVSQGLTLSTASLVFSILKNIDCKYYYRKVIVVDRDIYNHISVSQQMGPVVTSVAAVLVCSNMLYQLQKVT